MSSADTFLNIASVSLHRLSVGKPRAADSQRNLLQVRVLTVAICLAAAILVVVSPDIVDLMVGAFSSLVIMAPSLLYVFFAREPKAMPALVSVLFGVVVFVVLFFGVAGMTKTAFTVATIVALLALFIGMAIMAVLPEKKEPQGPVQPADTA